MSYRIEAARLDQMDEVRSLFREYASSLSVDLCFQGFERELAELPGRYDPILLAYAESGECAGCVALRPLEPRISEGKRLFVRPAFRGTGLGRLLVEELLRSARERGFLLLRLDTLPEMRDAIQMYKRMGFREIAAYCNNPVTGAMFMEYEL